MKFVEIRDERELEALEPAWNTLLREAASNSIFLTFEWIATWWRCYGAPGDLRLLAVYDEEGILRGIAPLRRIIQKRYGQSVSALNFVGDGSNDSDYLDFIVSREWQDRVMPVFCSHLEAELERGNVLLLNEIPATSPTLSYLDGLTQKTNAVNTAADIPCGSVRLPATWDAYLGMLKPRFRTKVRSVLRNLESRPEIQFHFCETPEAIEPLLRTLFDLHTRRWALDGKPGVFRWAEKRRFYSQLTSVLLERGWLRFSWMEWNGRVLACQYGFVYQDTYYHLQEGYEPLSDHWNVGIGLRAWTIREFLRQGVREYDFLGGMGRHKADWGAELFHSKRIQLASGNWKNRLFCLGPDWEIRAREYVSNLLPQSVLDLRRSHLQSKAAAAVNNGDGISIATSNGLSARQRVEQAFAGLYFHSGMPAVIRPFREQYQFTGSLQKRKEPVGRILIYHRINDDDDPHFGAVTTKVFESEMRYIARHHKVVSLTEYMRRLDAGNPESMVAITFDDGYRDNYTHALPILEKYGLPATIFLTTGSIDTGDPLWFEELAEAIKKTGKEFIDLEIDIPRRLWLRTPEERRRSNDEIVTILRRLPDEERRARLRDHLVALGRPAVSERRGRMLTWDQVREMTSRGIEFGGHTVDHPYVSKLTLEQAVWQLSECKRRIEEELQTSVEHFAYPHGQEQDIGESGRHAVTAAGYKAAFTTIWGVNYQGTDRRQLKRGGPWDQAESIFAYKMDWYQLCNQ